MTEDDEALDVRDDDLELVRELAQAVVRQGEGGSDSAWTVDAARLIETLADVPSDSDRAAAREHLAQLPNSSS